MKKSLKNVFVVNCKYCLKIRPDQVTTFISKIRFPSILTSGVVYKFQCGLCNYGEYVWHLNVRNMWIYKYITTYQKQVKPKNSSITDHLFFCNHLASYDNFSILTHENKTFLLELKETLLIVRDKPFLDRNIILSPLYVRSTLVIRSSLEFLLLLIVAALFLLNGFFYYFVMCKCISHCSH